MLQTLIERMRNPDDEVRSVAEDDLHKLARSGTLGVEDARSLLRAATGDFPEGQHGSHDLSCSLVYAAREIVKDKDPAALLPSIESEFARLSPEARQASLGIVTMVHTPAAARYYIQCLRERPEQLDRLLPVYSPEAGAEVAATLFPAPLDCASQEEFAFPILRMLWEFLGAGLLPPTVATGHENRVTERFRAELARARALQRATGRGWKDEEPYSSTRDLVGLLLDLSGQLESAPLLAIAREASDLSDAYLRRFRAISLLRRAEQVTDEELEWIAQSPRDRYWLFDQLHAINAPNRLPEACRDQVLLAEGHMVDWLCFGTELGREPDEIELLHRETRRRSSGPRLLAWLGAKTTVDYFFFRYRVTEEHWSKEDGWMVGMAGGYARDMQPTTRHDGGTFSHFTKLEEKTLQQHVASFLD